MCFFTASAEQSGQVNHLIFLSQTQTKPSKHVTTLNTMPKFDSVIEYESSEVMIKHSAEIKSSERSLRHQYLFLDYDSCRGEISWHQPLQSVGQGPSPKRPTELVNAMITSNSGCDLRPPVDTYAFKCEAKQCSLEVALTTSCCAACAFTQRDSDLRVSVLEFS